MAWWRVPTSRRPAREGHSPKGTQHQIPPRFSQDTRRRSGRVCPWEASQTVRYRPQHACISACMPIVLSCSTYAILAVIPLIRSITARAHHPHQALDPNVPRTYSCRLISQLVFAKQTGEARRHACRQSRKSKAKQALFRAGHRSLGDGQWWTHSWTVVVTRRRVRLRLRLRLVSCVCVFHHTSHP